jgi:hypothetical protein
MAVKLTNTKEADNVRHIYIISMRDPERQNHLGDLDVDGCDNIQININIRYDAMFTTRSCMSELLSTH